MTSKQALDFIVGETVQQAVIDGRPLTEIQRRMMYFTEQADAVEDPIALNEEFEADNDTNEYEEGMGELLGRAYRRLKRDDPRAKLEWDSAINELRKGDYYLLVLWSHRPGGMWKMWLPFLAIVSVYFVYHVLAGRRP